MKFDKIPILSNKRYIVLLVIVIGIILVISGFEYRSYEENKIKEEKFNDLKIITELKVKYMQNWLNERKADLNVIVQSSFYKFGLTEWLENKTDTIKKNLLNDRLSVIHRSYQYDDILILSTKGELLLSIKGDEKSLSDKTIEFIKHSNSSNSINQYFYFCPKHNGIHFDIISPVYNKENTIIANVILRINPHEYLFPSIQSRLLPLKSGETLIVRREGDSIVFLNELKYKNNTTLKLKAPLSNKEMPAVLAVLGEKGIIEGIDYRGVRVIAIAKKVPGTDWFMVAKVDKEEIFSEINEKTIIIFSFIFVLYIALIMGLSFIYKSRQRDIFRELYAQEKKLREYQEEFRATLYGIGDGVIVSDETGRVKYLNKVAEELTGWSETEAIGNKIERVFNIVNEDTRNIVENPVSRVLKEGVVVGLANHTILIDKHGTDKPIADSGSPIKNQNGETSGVVLVFRDQTDERNYQKKLEESECQLRQIIENTEAGYFLIDKKGYFNQVNPAWLRMHKYTSQDEIIGKHYSLTQVDIDLEKSNQIIENILNSDGSKSGEFSRLCKDGSVGYHSYSVRSVEKNGEIIGLEGFLIDTTEKVIAEQALKFNETIFNAFLENSPIFVFFKDSEIKAIKLSRNYEQMLGMPVENAIGKTMDELFPSDLAKKMVEDDKLILSGNKHVRVVEELNNRFYETTKFPVYFNGEPELLAGFTIDITERKKFEEELIKQKNFYEQMFAQSSISTQILDKEGWCERINPKLSQIFGVKPENIEGKIYNIFKDQGIIEGGVIPHLERVFNEGKTAEWEVFFDIGIASESQNIEVEEKKRVWYHNWAYPIFDNNGNMSHVIIQHTDISNRKNTELALMESEERFRSIFENATVGFCRTNPDGNVLMMNKAGLNILGFHSVEEYNSKGMENRGYVNRSDSERILEYISKSDEIHNFEAQWQRKDGTPVDIRESSRAIRNQSGEIIFYEGIFEDITEQKKAEELMIQNGLRMNFIIELANLDSTSLNDYYNYLLKKSLELTGSSIGFIGLVDESETKFTLHTWAADAIDDSVNTNNPIEFSVNNSMLVTEVLRTRKYVIVNDYKSSGFCRKGSPKWHVEIKNFISLPYIHNGKIISVLSIGNKQGDFDLNDVTQLSLLLDGMWGIIERRQYMSDLEAAKAIAEESNQLKTAFLQNMSHEIRTPMNGILGFAQLLKEKDIKENIRTEYAEIIYKSGQRLLSLLNNILDISKIESSKTIIKETTVDLNQNLEEIMEFNKIIAKDKKMLLKLNNTLKNDESRILIDITKLNQILQNLISNSLKFTSEGYIELGCSKTGSSLLFYVRDTGVGISKEYHSKIYDRFFQVHSDRNRDYEGAGLGLSLVKGFVEILGGQIWLESEIDVGTVFFFTLPYKPVKQNNNPISSKTYANSINLINKTILIAEDDIYSSEYLEKLLRSFKCNVISARNGAEALDYFKENPTIDLVLMDIRMPIMDGLEATKMILEVNPLVPIIAQTAYAFIHERETALAAGCKDIITKPIDKNILIEKISNSLFS
jgi:PAS domain S-box-containing protein